MEQIKFNLLKREAVFVINEDNEGLYETTLSNKNEIETAHSFLQNMKRLILSIQSVCIVRSDINKEGVGFLMKGSDLVLTLTGDEINSFIAWLDWQKGLGNTVGKEVAIFPRGRYLPTEQMEEFSKRYSYIFLGSANVIVNLKDLRSYLIQKDGALIKSEINDTVQYFHRRTRHPYPLVKSGDVVMATNDSSTAYVFCEYQGVASKPWCECLVMNVVDGRSHYTILRRSEFKPLDERVIEDSNILGQKVFNKYHPELI